MASMTTLDYSLDNAIVDELTFSLDNNTVHIRSYNPHGFYRISLDKGRLPNHLTGNYTSKRTAELDVRQYFADKIKPVAAAKE